MLREAHIAPAMPGVALYPASRMGKSSMCSTMRRNVNDRVGRAALAASYRLCVSGGFIYVAFF